MRTAGSPGSLDVLHRSPQRRPGAFVHWLRRQQVGVAAPLTGEQLVDSPAQVGAGGCRQRAHRLVTEHGLEDAPPATATSPATSPPVWANTTIISIRPSPLTPNAR